MTRPTSRRINAKERRIEVANMYIKGMRQADIANHFGVSQQQISYDIKKIQEEWENKYTGEINKFKSNELARIDALENEYWKQYELSKRDKLITTTKQVEKDGGDKSASLSYQRKEQREGESKYLNGIQWCIDQRSKILGVYEDVKRSRSSDIKINDFLNEFETFTSDLWTVLSLYVDKENKVTLADDLEKITQKLMDELGVNG